MQLAGTLNGYSERMLDYITKDNLPEIRDWQLCFDGRHGKTNRLNVVNAFRDFIISSEIRELPMPGLCLIEGKMYGHKFINDGDKVVTSFIRKMFVLNPTLLANDDTKAYIGIETSNGRHYCISCQDKVSTKIF